jgi:ribonuclease BN (tRNA processing enzyme)
MGSGSFGALQRLLHPTEVDAIVLSHLHADHCLDLIPLVVAMRWDPRRAGHRIRLIGPKNTAGRLVGAYGESTKNLALDELFEIEEPVDGALGPLQVRYTKAEHPGPAYSIRLSEGGKSLAYSGDTGPSPNLVTLSQGATVALFEAGWPAGSADGRGLHLTPAGAARHARDADVQRLVLTHLPPWADRDAALSEAGRIFDGPISVAAADATVVI